MYIHWASVWLYIIIKSYRIFKICNTCSQEFRFSSLLYCGVSSACVLQVKCYHFVSTTLCGYKRSLSILSINLQCTTNFVHVLLLQSAVQLEAQVTCSHHNTDSDQWQTDVHLKCFGHVCGVWCSWEVTKHNDCTHTSVRKESREHVCRATKVCSVCLCLRVSHRSTQMKADHESHLRKCFANVTKGSIINMQAPDSSNIYSCIVMCGLQTMLHLAMHGLQYYCMQCTMSRISFSKYIECMTVFHSWLSWM